ncbi:MAG: YdcF family protein [Geminicoccaceae bacterium]
MNFILSKLLWMLVQPTNLLLFMAFIAALLALDIRHRMAGRLAVAMLLLLLVVATLPVGLWLREPLEDRFSRPDPLPDRVTGIIVLGGAQVPVITHDRGVLAVNERAERLVEAVELARLYPEARLLLTGGNGALGTGGVSEGEVNRIFIRMTGLDPRRVIYEEQSRNMYENALDSKAIIRPDASEIWLLVTSAFHMPRSVGIFRKAGWPVVPWPVDYQTVPGQGMVPEINMSGRLLELDESVREWIGLAAYYLMGRTDALFPAPR